MIEPCASSTARETMFSEAISSISFCWRWSSLAIAWAIFGSVLSSFSLKKPGNKAVFRALTLTADFLTVFLFAFLAIMIPYPDFAFRLQNSERRAGVQ